MATAEPVGHGIHIRARRIDLCVVPGDTRGRHIRWRTGYGHIELPRLALVFLMVAINKINMKTSEKCNKIRIIYKIKNESLKSIITF